MLKIVNVRPFHSAVVSCLMSIGAVVMLLRIFWQYPEFHIWGIVGAAIVLAIVFFQLVLLYSVYRQAYSTVMAERDPVLATTWNMLIRTFQWGNALALVIVIIVFECMHIKS